MQGGAPTTPCDRLGLEIYYEGDTYEGPSPCMPSLPRFERDLSVIFTGRWQMRAFDTDRLGLLERGLRVTCPFGRLVFSAIPGYT